VGYAQPAAVRASADQQTLQQQQQAAAVLTAKGRIAAFQLPNNFGACWIFHILHNRLGDVRPKLPLPVGGWNRPGPNMRDVQ